jgi:hypothetical protein
MLEQWIKTTWDDSSQESIIKGFKNCYMLNDTNGRDDDVLWKIKKTSF